MALTWPACPQTICLSERSVNLTLQGQILSKTTTTTQESLEQTMKGLGGATTTGSGSHYFFLANDSRRRKTEDAKRHLLSATHRLFFSSLGAPAKKTTLIFKLVDDIYCFKSTQAGDVLSNSNNLCLSW